MWASSILKILNTSSQNDKNMKKILTKAFRWLFPICAISVSAICIIQGHYVLSVWPIIASVFQYIADEFMELSEHAVEYGDAMMLENLEMLQKLCDAEIKIVELKAEIDELKKETGQLSPKEMAREREVIAEEATQWLRNNLKDKHNRGVFTWQIIEDFRIHMGNFIHGTRKA